MTHDWQDKTSYQRGETPQIPRVWELKFGRFRLLVHRLHGINATWFVTCHGLRVEDHDAQTDEVAGAQAFAVGLAHKLITEAATDLGLTVNP